MVEVYEADIRDFPFPAPNRQLRVLHSPQADNNLSRYLLKILGADGRNLLKSARHGQFRTLGFRDLARLCVINSERISDTRSPVLASGQTANAVAERSVFKLLLTGEDEPESFVGPGDVEKNIGLGRADLLDDLIADAQSRLAIPASEFDLQNQLTQVEESLAAAAATNEELVARRFALVERERFVSSRVAGNRERAGELEALLGRFDLLNQQYESDLGRLQMVAEAGNLLGYFSQNGPCVFCGAAPGHQNPGHQMGDAQQLQVAAGEEIRKTAGLRDDLSATMADLAEQLRTLESEYAELAIETDDIRIEVARLNGLLAPLSDGINELLTSKTQIQADLALHVQIQRLESAKKSRPDGIPEADISGFETAVHATLARWRIPGDIRVSYNQKTADMSVGNLPRNMLGRGMRSIAHAAFTVALARFAANRSRLHPGFIVLDSPLAFGGIGAIPFDVIANFYRSLHDDPSAQVIIVENVDPPDDLSGQATLHPFHTSGASRRGFYPA
ncbi:hypothetical protein [Streptomyces sp. LS1784]|uniref:hypothetical protein n=1 Tax=Streptomyces sp. LS1784 TaxID=2851533 RepID=UPI001CC9561D|nr:hypothetical protein [Streptomyces sp. LS1784]